MNDTSLAELQKMQRNLASNQRNAEFRLKLGQIYYDLSLGSSVGFRLEEQVKVTNILDWQSYQAAIQHAYSSFTLSPTIDSALVILNSFDLVGNHGSAVNFIFQENLVEKLPNEKLTIVSILFHSLAKKGLLLQAAQLLYEFSPEDFRIAQQKAANTEESPQLHFDRSVRADCARMFKKGYTDKDFLGSCEELLDDYQRERNIQDHLANNMSWDYDYCFNTAVELHKQGFMRMAMQMYALAFVLNPSENIAEFYSVVSLHMMGENQVAFQKMNQFIDKDPKLPWAYVIGGHACAMMNDITGLELILTKADLHNIKLPLLDFLKGFCLESKGQSNQALSLYEKCIQVTSVEMFSNLYKFHIERIRHEQ
jgi:tetratricopeptide (TPR) repeat protein